METEEEHASYELFAVGMEVYPRPVVPNTTDAETLSVLHSVWGEQPLHVVQVLEQEDVYDDGTGSMLHPQVLILGIRANVPLQVTYQDDDVPQPFRISGFWLTTIPPQSQSLLRHLPAQ